jgi:nucleotide-binding universal stress UspA family protein
MIARLLVLVDGSPFGLRAVPYAAWLAAAGGEVLLVRAATADEPREDAELEVAHAVGCLQRRGLAARACVQGAGDCGAADVVLAAQRAYQADLIVLATHGGRGPERLPWGRTADEVLRRAPVPVLLAPKRSQQTWPRRRALRVLLWLDASQPREPALRLVTRLATIRAIRLILTGLAGSVRPVGADTWATIDVLASTAMECLNDYLDEVASRMLLAGAETSVYGGSSNPGPRLADLARDEHCDVVVLATTSHRAVLRALIGDAAPHCRYRSSVPLLLMPRAVPAPST